MEQQTYALSRQAALLKEWPNDPRVDAILGRWERLARGHHSLTRPDLVFGFLEARACFLGERQQWDGAIAAAREMVRLGEERRFAGRTEQAEETLTRVLFSRATQLAQDQNEYAAALPLAGEAYWLATHRILRDGEIHEAAPAIGQLMRLIRQTP